MQIGARTFAGQPLGAGMYIPITTVSMWEAVQYVTLDRIERLLEPGFFNKLYQYLQPPAKIEVACYAGDDDGSGEWRYYTLAVTKNTFDATNPGAGGAVSVRVLQTDEALMPAAYRGRRSIHQGHGRYNVENADGETIATGLTKEEAAAKVMEPEPTAETAEAA